MSAKQRLFKVFGIPVNRESRIRMLSFSLAGGFILIAYWIQIIHVGTTNGTRRYAFEWILWGYHLGALENDFWFVVVTYAGFVVWPSSRISKARGLKPVTISAMALPAFVMVFFVLTLLDKLIMPAVQY